jgi:hypothetical protein
MSSGQPVNNIADMKKVRDRYINNLDLEIENNDYNLKQNKKFLFTGVTSKLKDYRTVDEKLKDVYKLKTDLRNDLLEITDGSNAQQIVNSLADNDVIFLAQNIENIKTDIKKKFKYGVLSDLFLDYFNKYTQLQNKNYGLLNPFYETTLDNISNKINSINNVIINTMDIDYLKQALENVKNEEPQKYNDLLKRLNLIENQINYVNFHKDNIEDMTNEEKREFDNIVQTLPSQQFMQDVADELNEDISRDRKIEVLAELKNKMQSKSDYNPPNEDPESLRKLLTMDEIRGLKLNDLKQYINYLSSYLDKDSIYQNAMTKLKTTKIKQDYKDFFNEFNDDLYSSGLPTYWDWELGNQGANKDEKKYKSDINDFLQQQYEETGRYQEPLKLEMMTEKEKEQEPFISLKRYFKYIYDNLQDNEPYKEKIDKILNSKSFTGNKPFISFINQYNDELYKTGIKTFKDWKQENQRTGKGVLYTNNKKIRMKGRGITIDKIDYKNSINQDKKFLYFGKYLIDKNKLEHNNVLSLKSKKGTLIKSDILNNKIKDILLEFIKQGKLNYDEYYNLSNEEKNYIYDLYKQSNLIDKLNIKSPDKSENDKIIDRFLILKGQLNAGNDSLDLIKEFKLILLKLKNMKLLPKNEVNNMLELLLSLGY